MSFLGTTKFVCSGEYLFYISELNGIFGRIDPKTGTVKLYDNTPDAILGKLSFKTVMISYNDEIYIVCQEGKTLYKFNCLKESFSLVAEDLEMAPISCSWAGSLMYRESLFLFDREQGWYVEYNLAGQEIKKGNTGIKEKVCWCCSIGSVVYLLNWSMDIFYTYDVSDGKITANTVDLSNILLDMSKSPFPLHTMQYNDQYLYLVRAKSIYRYNVNTKMVELFFRREEGDNGARIVAYKGKIYVPSFEGDTVDIVDADTKRVESHIKIDDSRIVYKELKGNSRTGIPCCLKDFIFFPLIATNGYVSIDSDSYGLQFMEYYADKFLLSQIVKKMSEKSVKLLEDETIGLEELISSLTK